ncbi:MAG TPA: CDP-diacylglycerol--serine O-phosphatidyltransferase [Candidatus Absconditabacterales bacterium]|nr:CDP-diacylglycerol--serine O-phosphatidyltransferase [Candidatus Absconditabacterales bacterium]HMT26689.1 CDP-diacylglycerol--serine O-phosphatidyltransferase [Candidatus Absconditabacterales bacterium]
MNLATFLTMANLFVGFFAILLVVNMSEFYALIMLPIAMVLDFFDGYVARTMRQESKLGEQLDSLADMVSFGVAPALLIYAHSSQGFFVIIILLFFVGAGAYRLARFNAQKIQSYGSYGAKKGYEGLPITINGIAIPILIFLFSSFERLLLFFVLVISFLMVSKIKIPKL